MSAKDRKKKTLSSNGIERNRLPKLPPIPQLMTTKDRFDNSPLLKYRRAEEVQNVLANKVYVFSV